ncbi:hypothetical protein FRX31_006684 [Thalictrum thalictroides]|uniref:Uncharacterized protein n=1 Tax=Thalictrum thalictroides TaxID=46969 RepID=A0A7J6X1Y1_THATH|nr:hypothetical protein FRX31_006684 [Thalictrum thalictroides]
MWHAFPRDSGRLTHSRRPSALLRPLPAPGQPTLQQLNRCRAPATCSNRTLGSEPFRGLELSSSAGPEQFFLSSSLL